MPNSKSANVSFRCTSLEFDRYQSRALELNMTVSAWTRAMVEVALDNKHTFKELCHTYHHPGIPRPGKATKAHPEAILAGRVQTSIAPNDAMQFFELARLVPMKPTTAYRAILYAAITHRWQPLTPMRTTDGHFMIHVPVFFRDRIHQLTSFKINGSELSSIYKSGLLVKAAKLNASDWVVYRDKLKNIVGTVLWQFYGMHDETRPQDQQFRPRLEMTGFEYEDRLELAPFFVRTIDILGMPDNTLLNALAGLIMVEYVHSLRPKRETDA